MDTTFGLHLRANGLPSRRAEVLDGRSTPPTGRQLRAPAGRRNPGTAEVGSRAGDGFGAKGAAA
eukprot:907221-Alexandrium_andersonii.AAC.1